MFRALSIIPVVACMPILLASACHQDDNGRVPSEQAGQVTLDGSADPASPVKAGASALSPTLMPVPAGEGRYPAGPARPAATVQIEPGDMTTSVGASPLHILVSNLGAPVGIDLLNRLGATVTLVTWPELTDVPVTVTQILDASGKSNEDEFAHIYIAPVTPLADRWYAISLAALPKGVAWPVFSNTLISQNGTRRARFRVGSDPTVAGLRVYTKGSKDVVYIDFSERVAGDMTLVQVSYAGGGSANCVADAAVAQVASPSTGTLPAQGSGLVPPPNTPSVGASLVSARLICNGPIDLSQSLQLDVGPGLRSTSGPQVNGGAPLRLVVAPASWIDWGDGGKLFRP